MWFTVSRLPGLLQSLERLYLVRCGDNEHTMCILSTFIPFPLGKKITNSPNMFFSLTLLVAVVPNEKTLSLKLWGSPLMYTKTGFLLYIFPIQSWGTSHFQETCSSRMQTEDLSLHGLLLSTSVNFK